MSRLSLLALVVAALFACSAPRQTAAPSPVVEPAPPIVVAYPDAAPVADASIADAAPSDAPAPVDPHIARLRVIATDRAALAAAIDPARGVTVIHYVEAPPSGRGREEHTSQHLCGVGLARALPTVQRALAEAVAQAEGIDAIDCANHECVVPGMEYQPAWHLYFVDMNGSLQLEALAQVSEAALGEAWLTRARTYVTRGLAAARARPCTPQRR